jgi:glycosyltransferase involved in cell wall biosynthesis
MIGRLSPEKDPHTLIRAAGIACTADAAFRLEIAGDGRCRESAVELTKTLGLEDRVRFHGEVRDVTALLARASQYVLPSLSEGISLSLLEAMSSGLPVAATRAGGTPEVVEHGRTGLLVSPQSPEELASAMLELHRNPMGAREMGRAAHEHVRRHFDARRMVGEYADLYEQCVLPQRAPRRAA